VSPTSSGGNLTPAEQLAMIAVAPDEGTVVDDDTFDFLQRRYESLTDAQRAPITEIATQAMRASLSFHTKGYRTLRRYEIMRGLVCLAEVGITDEVLCPILETILGDVVYFSNVTVGHAVGSLDWTRAAEFARLISLHSVA